MIIYLASNHSASVHPFNTPAKFTVQMPEVFTRPKSRITQGKWHLGLIDIVTPPIKSLTNKWDVVYIKCNQVDGVVMSEMYSKVLRSFTLGEIKRHNMVRFSPVLYVPLRVTDVKDITIELWNERGNLLHDINTASDTDTTKCTLELIWKRDINH